MTTISQRSFTGGELSPAVSARADLAKYQTGLSTLRNFFVMKHGGISNRAGTQFICEVSDSTRRVRLIDFVFSVDQSYILEFGHLYMRVIRDGELLSTASGNSVTGISVAAEAVVTHTAHGYSTDDEVRFYGIRGGMTSMNGRIFTIEVVDANSYKLKLRGSYFSTVGMAAYQGSTPYATAYLIYKIDSQYDEADLATLNFAQSADVMTIVHPNYPITELSRTGHTSWTFAEASLVPRMGIPTAMTITQAGSGGTSQTLKYKVTAIDPDTGEESIVGIETTQTVTGITNANPAVVTTSGAHNFNDGDEVRISTSHPTSMAGLFNSNNQKYYTVDVQSATTFYLVDESGSNIDTSNTTIYPAFVGGFFSCARSHTQVVGAPSAATPTILRWSPAINTASPFKIAKEYNVYKAVNGVYGWAGSVEAGSIGTANSVFFNDPNITPDLTDGPPNRNNPFDEEDDYPSTVNFYQQRRMFASSNNGPQTVWGSRSGNFSNFTTSNPLQDDDSVQFDLVGKRVNRIKHMLDLGQLVILTSDGEFGVNGNESGVLKPSDINAKQYTYNGCGDLAPIVIDSSAIYLQARGTIIRDLGFDYESNGYRGNDLTIFSAHLFENQEIVDWAYQKTPHSIVWAARDDGKLLGLTYIREQELLAWHRHDIQDSTVENTCVIPEDQNDMLYLVANLTVDEEERRYILRMSVRSFSDVAVDCTILDSFLTYDGRNGNLGFVAETTMTLSGGTTWSADELLTLTAGAAMFNTVADDIGNEIHLKVGTEVLRCVIVDDPSNTSTVVKVRAHKTVPAAFRSVAISDWNRAVDSISGLWHLEGKEVSVFADGFVEANPNNKAYTVITVTDGAIQLSQCYGVVHVGLPVTSDFQTLDVEFVNAESMVGKKVNIGKVHLKVLDSRGLFVGPNKPTDAEELSRATFLKGLTEEKIRQYEGYDSPIALKTGEFNILMKGEWKSNGRFFARNTDPTPCTILSIHPEGNIPVKGVG